MADVPVVETPRLRLRAHRPDDLAELAAMWADPAVVRFVGGKPLSREDVWAKLLRTIGHWRALDYGYWVVEDRSTGRFLGEVGLGDAKRETEPSFAGTPEAGWAFAAHAHGKGYATEGVRAALAWHESTFGRVRTVCIIAPEHAASIHVAEKCGYREFARTVYKGEPTLIFER